MKKYLLLLMFICNNSFAWGWGSGPFIPYGGFNYGFGYSYYSYPLIYPYPVYQQQQPIIIQQNPQPIIIQSPPQTIIIEKSRNNCPTCNYKEYDERFKRYQEK